MRCAEMLATLHSLAQGDFEPVEAKDLCVRGYLVLEEAEAGVFDGREPLEKRSGQHSDVEEAVGERFREPSSIKGVVFCQRAISGDSRIQPILRPGASMPFWIAPPMYTATSTVASFGSAVQSKNLGLRVESDDHSGRNGQPYPRTLSLTGGRWRRCLLCAPCPAWTFGALRFRSAAP